MIEKLRGIFQNRQESSPELAAEPTAYHKGDIVRREEPNGGYQFGIIKRVQRTGTPIEILTFEIHQDYDIKGQLTGNFVGTTLPIPNTSKNLFRMREKPLLLQEDCKRGLEDVKILLLFSFDTRTPSLLKFEAYVN